MRFLIKIYLLLFLLLSFGLNAQNYKERQKKLEAQKLSIKKEIQQINALINDSRNKSKNIADELEDIQLKISVRDRLIKINNSQVNNLNNIIFNQKKYTTSNLLQGTYQCSLATSKLPAIVDCKSWIVVVKLRTVLSLQTFSVF